MAETPAPAGVSVDVFYDALDPEEYAAELSLDVERPSASDESASAGGESGKAQADENAGAEPSSPQADESAGAEHSSPPRPGSDLIRTPSDSEGPGLVTREELASTSSTRTVAGSSSSAAFGSRAPAQDDAEPSSLSAPLSLPAAPSPSPSRATSMAHPVAAASGASQAVHSAAASSQTAVTTHSAAPSPRHALPFTPTGLFPSARAEGPAAQPHRRRRLGGLLGPLDIFGLSRRSREAAQRDRERRAAESTNEPSEQAAIGREGAKEVEGAEGAEGPTQLCAVPGMSLTRLSAHQHRRAPDAGSPRKTPCDRDAFVAGSSHCHLSRSSLPLAYEVGVTLRALARTATGVASFADHQIERLGHQIAGGGPKGPCGEGTSKDWGDEREERVEAKLGSAERSPLSAEDAQDVRPAARATPTEDARATSTSARTAPATEARAVPPAPPAPSATEARAVPPAPPAPSATEARAVPPAPPAPSATEARAVPPAPPAPSATEARAVPPAPPAPSATEARAVPPASLALRIAAGTPSSHPPPSPGSFSSQLARVSSATSLSSADYVSIAASAVSRAVSPEDVPASSSSSFSSFSSSSSSSSSSASAYGPDRSAYSLPEPCLPRRMRVSDALPVGPHTASERAWSEDGLEPIVETDESVATGGEDGRTEEGERGAEDGTDAAPGNDLRGDAAEAPRRGDEVASTSTSLGGAAAEAADEAAPASVDSGWGASNGVSPTPPALRPLSTKPGVAPAAPVPVPEARARRAPQTAPVPSPGSSPAVPPTPSPAGSQPLASSAPSRRRTHHPCHRSYSLPPLALHAMAHSQGGVQCADPELWAQQRSAVVGMLASFGRQLLRGNIDLVHVSMPVKLFEPRSFLEKMTDTWAYPEHLERAALYAAAGDDLAALQCVVAFFLLGLHREFVSWRKPFNPLLGETWVGRAEAVAETGEVDDGDDEGNGAECWGGPTAADDGNGAGGWGRPTAADAAQNTSVSRTPAPSATPSSESQLSSIADAELEEIRDSIVETRPGSSEGFGRAGSSDPAPSSGCTSASPGSGEARRSGHRPSSETSGGAPPASGRSSSRCARQGALHRGGSPPPSEPHLLAAPQFPLTCFCEQVSHHPPASACLVRGGGWGSRAPQRFELTACAVPKVSYGSSSITTSSDGQCSVSLGASGATYDVSVPRCVIKGLLSRQPPRGFLEGRLEVIDRVHGLRCAVRFGSSARPDVIKGLLQRELTIEERQCLMDRVEAFEGEVVRDAGPEAVRARGEASHAASGASSPEKGSPPRAAALRGFRPRFGLPFGGAASSASGSSASLGRQGAAADGDGRPPPKTLARLHGNWLAFLRWEPTAEVADVPGARAPRPSASDPFLTGADPIAIGQSPSVAWRPVGCSLPSDSSRREDLALLAQGKVDEAQAAKERIEVRQRNDATLRKEGRAAEGL